MKEELLKKLHEDEIVDLSNQDITNNDLKEIAKAIGKNSKLTSLDLSNNAEITQIIPNGTSYEFIEAVIIHSTLINLKISNTNNNDNEIAKFIQSINQTISKKSTYLPIIKPIQESIDKFISDLPNLSYKDARIEYSKILELNNSVKDKLTEFSPYILSKIHYFLGQAGIYYQEENKIAVRNIFFQVEDSLLLELINPVNYIDLLLIANKISHFAPNNLIWFAKFQIKELDLTEEQINNLHKSLSIIFKYTKDVSFPSKVSNAIVNQIVLGINNAKNQCKLEKINFNVKLENADDNLLKILKARPEIYFNAYNSSVKMDRENNILLIDHIPSEDFLNQLVNILKIRKGFSEIQIDNDISLNQDIILDFIIKAFANYQKEFTVTIYNKTQGKWKLNLPQDFLFLEKPSNNSQTHYKTLINLKLKYFQSINSAKTFPCKPDVSFDHLMQEFITLYTSTKIKNNFTDRESAQIEYEYNYEILKAAMLENNYEKVLTALANVRKLKNPSLLAELSKYVFHRYPTYLITACKVTADKDSKIKENDLSQLVETSIKFILKANLCAFNFETMIPTITLIFNFFKEFSATRDIDFKVFFENFWKFYEEIKTKPIKSIVTYKLLRNVIYRIILEILHYQKLFQINSDKLSDLATHIDTYNQVILLALFENNALLGTIINIQTESEDKKFIIGQLKKIYNLLYELEFEQEEVFQQFKEALKEKNYPYLLKSSIRDSLISQGTENLPTIDDFQDEKEDKFKKLGKNNLFIDLSKQNIISENLDQIGNLIQTNPLLTSLDLSNNEIISVSYNFLNIIIKHPKLKFINLANNSLEEETKNDIECIVINKESYQELTKTLIKMILAHKLALPTQNFSTSSEQFEEIMFKSIDHYKYFRSFRYIPEEFKSQLSFILEANNFYKSNISKSGFAPKKMHYNELLLNSCTISQYTPECTIQLIALNENQKASISENEIKYLSLYLAKYFKYVSTITFSGQINSGIIDQIILAIQNAKSDLKLARIIFEKVENPKENLLKILRACSTLEILGNNLPLKILIWNSKKKIEYFITADNVNLLDQLTEIFNKKYDWDEVYIHDKDKILSDEKIMMFLIKAFANNNKTLFIFSNSKKLDFFKLIFKMKDLYPNHYLELYRQLASSIFQRLRNLDSLNISAADKFKMINDALPKVKEVIDHIKLVLPQNEFIISQAYYQYYCFTINTDILKKNPSVLKNLKKSNNSQLPKLFEYFFYHYSQRLFVEFQLSKNKKDALKLLMDDSLNFIDLALQNKKDSFDYSEQIPYIFLAFSDFFSDLAKDTTIKFEKFSEFFWVVYERINLQNYASGINFKLLQSFVSRVTLENLDNTQFGSMKEMLKNISKAINPSTESTVTKLTKQAHLNMSAKDKPLEILDLQLQKVCAELSTMKIEKISLIKPTLDLPSVFIQPQIKKDEAKKEKTADDKEEFIKRHTKIMNDLLAPPVIKNLNQLFSEESGQSAKDEDVNNESTFTK